MPGPTKRPTALTDALGNPGKRPKPKAEPKPEPLSNTQPPPFLDEHGREEWHRLTCELLKLGLLTTLDVTMLALYCQSHSDFVRYTDFIEQNGETYEAANGMIRTRPEVHMRQKAAQTIMRTCAEFGFSPSARARMNVTLEPRKTVTLDDILNGTEGNVQ